MLDLVNDELYKLVNDFKDQNVSILFFANTIYTFANKIN